MSGPAVCVLRACIALQLVKSYQSSLGQSLLLCVQIANSDMERFWRLVNTDVRETLQPRLPELRPSACEAMISGLQKL